MTTKRTAEIAAARKADEQIAAAWAAYWEIQMPIDAFRAHARDHLKSAKRWGATKNGEYYAGLAAKNTAAADSLVPKAALQRENAIALDKALYTGWTRFFLVQHIHSSQHCSSFRPTTRVGWLPEVSGLTEAEAVKEHGAILCTICFPSAPVEFTNGQKNDGNCTGHRDSSAPSRSGYVSGNWATCTCGQRVTLTSAGNLRKHKAN